MVSGPLLQRPRLLRASASARLIRCRTSSGTSSIQTRVRVHQCVLPGQGGAELVHDPVPAMAAFLGIGGAPRGDHVVQHLLAVLSVEDAGAGAVYRRSVGASVRGRGASLLDPSI